MYLNTALIEVELEQRRQLYVRDARNRYANGELIHAPGRTWRETRPFRAIFSRSRLPEQPAA